MDSCWVLEDMDSQQPGIMEKSALADAMWIVIRIN